MRHAVVRLIALYALAASSVVNAQTTEVQEVLAKCLRNLEYSDNIQYSGESSSQGSGMASRVSTSKRCVFRRSRHLVDAVTSREVRGHVSRSRFTTTDRFLIQYQTDTTTDLQAVDTLRPNSGVVYKEKLEDERSRILSNFADLGCFLDGYYQSGPKRVPQWLMEAGDARIVEGDEANAQLVTVTGSTPYGNFTISIDVNRGHGIVALAFEKLSEHFVVPGMKLGDAPEEQTFRRKLRSWTGEIRDVKLEQFGDFWVATSGVVSDSQNFEDGESYQITTTFERTEIEIDPEFDVDAFKSDLEPGLSVRYVDESESGLAYVWDGEKPVVYSDATTIPAQTRYQPNWRGTLIVGLCVVTLGLVCGISWVRSRRKKTS